MHSRKAAMQTASQSADRTIGDMFQELGPPDALLRSGAANNGAHSSIRVNAHIHLPPNFSAFDTVEQAVRLAAEQNVGILGTSNYYDYHVYREFAETASRHGIFPLFGIETMALLGDLARDGVKLNDPGNPGKMY